MISRIFIIFSDARKKAPDSIRAVFGDSKNDSRNACHGSDSPASAEREIEIIFPHIFKGSENVSNRPESGQSAMINGHSYPIREQTAVFQVIFLPLLFFPPINSHENQHEFW